ncbi:MAG: GNAT family N-acetyltransferase [Hyphomicrobium sp.]|nr:GNAT family N-acetyltransferase [Hyphomicrobium sp.]
MRTKRLMLRELNDLDVRRVALLAGDYDVARMTARIPYPYTEYDARHWLSGIDQGEFVRAVDYQGELIGLVGFTKNPDRSAEIGYWIGKPWWGHGFATEAAGALVNYCFQSARIPRLIGAHFIDNPASARVIEKLGFRCIGSSSAFCQARGHDVQALVYERKRPMTSMLWRPV